MTVMRQARSILIIATIFQCCATGGKRIGYRTGTLSLITPTTSITAARIAHRVTGTLETEDTIAVPTKSSDFKDFLEQKYELKPPITIVITFPAQTWNRWSDSYDSYGYTGWRGHNVSQDSIRKRIVDRLAKILPCELVKEVRGGSTMFPVSRMNDIQELAARYRADEALVLAFSLDVYQPATCLGMWPVFYLVGNLTAESMLIDTRTGFILINNTYHISRKSEPKGETFGQKADDLTYMMVETWTEKISQDLVSFYERTLKEGAGK